MRRILRVIAIVLFFFAMHEMQSQELPKKFRQHFVIVVDQGACQGHENMAKLYNDMVYAFDNGKLPEGLTLDSKFTVDFNPMKDEVTVYGSGITNNDFSSIYNACRDGSISEDKVNDQIVKALFHKEKSYTEFKKENGEKTIEEFFDGCLKTLMTKQGSYSGNIRVGLNEYLYPLMLKAIDLSVPAENYILIRISNFTSQGALMAVKEQQLKPLVANRDKYVNSFDSFIATIKSPYYEIEAVKLIRPSAGGLGNSTNVNNNPMAVGGFLRLITLQSTGVRNQNIPHFSQVKYNSDSFDYGNARVLFTHDDHLQMNQVFWIINDTCVIDMTDKVKYDKESSVYEFPQGQMQLANAKAGDKIGMKYVFYMQSYDDNSNPLLPMVFTSECYDQLSELDFVPAPLPSQFPWIPLLIGLILIIALVYLLYRLWKKRGLKRKVFLDFQIRPVSYTRFMEVKDKKVVNEDCWYMGRDNQNQKIAIKGKFSFDDVSFCKKYAYRYEYRVEDDDSEEQFTFRPDGKDGQGQELEKDQWYKLDVDSNGEFKLNVWTYLDKKHSPELNDEERLRAFFADKEHPYRILKLKIKFRVLVMDPKMYIKSLQIPDPEKPQEVCERMYPITNSWKEDFERTYSFIVKPDFERKTAWVAFDPGTTGSCAAFAFSGHQPWEADAVTLAKNQFSQTGTASLTSGIFPSVVKISEKARCFSQNEEVVSDVENWQIDSDFIIGNRAEQRLGNNRFKSIKKLLGYTNLLELKGDNVRRKISGSNLALLLVKGLYKQVSNYAMTNNDVDENLRKTMSDGYGNFAPTRAIVAVPNNYTLSKIQDMVDSVKRLGCFNEVHYLYESESVMMTYLHKMWRKLGMEYNDKVFVVYDMGGATINATAFKLNITFDDQNNIDRMEVQTIAKVGYCVGGDDIDFALIRVLYDMPAVSAMFASKDEKIKSMNQNKQKLIQYVTSLKLDLITRSKDADALLEYLANEETFINSVCTIMKECGVYVDATMFTDKDSKYIKKQLDSQNKKSSLMYKYVYSKVEDAVRELMSDLKQREVELIFSGRSSLYPHIQDFVTSTISDCGFTCRVWDGFNDEKGLNADMVKTAVAEGACWFAVFNSRIRLIHDVITSAFGYVDQQNGQPKFVPVVNRLERFVDGRLTHKVEPINKNINSIRFLQMLGSDYDTILENYEKDHENRHKINVLDVVPTEIVNGVIESISVTIEENNNFDYEVQTSTNSIKPNTNRYSRLFGHEGTAVETEISSENNDSYVFAALQSVDERFGDDTVEEPKKTGRTRTTRI